MGLTLPSAISFSACSAMRSIGSGLPASISSHSRSSSHSSIRSRTFSTTIFRSAFGRCSSIVTTVMVSGESVATSIRLEYSTILIISTIIFVCKRVRPGVHLCWLLYRYPCTNLRRLRVIVSQHFLDIADIHAILEKQDHTACRITRGALRMPVLYASGFSARRCIESTPQILGRGQDLTDTTILVFAVSVHESTRRKDRRRNFGSPAASRRTTTGMTGRLRINSRRIAQRCCITRYYGHRPGERGRERGSHDGDEKSDVPSEHPV
jgi:hypothetical protein